MANTPFLLPGVGIARYKFTCVGVPHVMGFSSGHLFTDPIAPDPALDLGVRFATTVLDNGGGMGTQWTFSGVDLIIEQVSGPPLAYEWSTAVVGTLSVNSAPPNCSMLIQKRTGNAGRNMRGRIFMPPAMIFDADIDAAGNMGGTLVAAHQLLWTEWLTESSSAGVALMLIHLYDPELSEPTVAPTPITQLVVQSKLATQRRRLR